MCWFKGLVLCNVETKQTVDSDHMLFLLVNLIFLDSVPRMHLLCHYLRLEITLIQQLISRV